MITTDVSGNLVDKKADVQRRTLENYNGPGTHFKRTPFRKKSISQSAYRHWVYYARLFTIPRNYRELLLREANRFIYLLVNKLRYK